MNRRTILASLIIGIVFYKGYTTTKSVVTPEKENQSSPTIIESIHCSASQLVQAYTTNEIYADQQYKGKRITIEGQVGTIGKDILNISYLTFTTGDSWREAQCYFSPEWEKVLVKLVPGDSLHLSGVVKGMCGNIQIDDCVIKAIPSNFKQR